MLFISQDLCCNLHDRLPVLNILIMTRYNAWWYKWVTSCIRYTRIALSLPTTGSLSNLVCSVLWEANINKFHFTELLVKIELKMQNDRININFGKQSIEYMVIR